MPRSTRSTLIPLALAFAVFSTATADAKILKGTVKTKMASIKALKKNGSSDPSKNAACHDKFHSLLGKVATTTYEIDTVSLKMTAKVTFEGSDYDLSALGLAGSYSFGKFFNPPEPPLGLYAVLFSLSKSGTSPSNSFGYVLNSETNCVVSSATNPFKSATAPKLGEPGS